MARERGNVGEKLEEGEFCKDNVEAISGRCRRSIECVLSKTIHILRFCGICKRNDIYICMRQYTFWDDTLRVRHTLQRSYTFRYITVVGHGQRGSRTD